MDAMNFFKAEIDELAKEMDKITFELLALRRSYNELSQNMGDHNALNSKISECKKLCNKHADFAKKCFFDECLKTKRPLEVAASRSNYETYGIVEFENKGFDVIEITEILEPVSLIEMQDYAEKLESRLKRGSQKWNY